MNLVERFNQFKIAQKFNRVNIKGVITVDDYSFDIRIFNGDLYANSLPLEDFFNEAMLSVDEELHYEQAIYEWINKIANSRVA
ncbi:hypothetical protein GCM10023149_47810 [Mucilaginibacter gynuensis]|uniref:Uncharacterized protein n=1 Tax=Mucilaginibacter gynuensis TaxID=1302236 RepID=A0ABP8HDZ1_9SPHI